MTKTNILLVGFLFASGSLLAVGCSDPAETDGSSSSSSSSSSSNSSSSGSSSSGSSSSSSGGGDAVTAYCTAVLANCTGANAQYADMKSCMGSAAAFPAGTSADMSGDTLGCRTYHAGAAKADAALHCPHAGPSGGGACGATCDGFCDIVAATCKTEWPDKTACMTACKALPSTMKNFSSADTKGNTVECRLYHGSVAASDAASAMTHCPHTAAVTKMGDPCF